MHFIPLHTENLGQHAFDEVVSQGKLARDLSAGGSQSDPAVLLNLG
jgi:hypothetical protein